MCNKSTKTIAIFLLIFFIGDRILSHAAIFVSKFSTLPYAKLYNRKLESNILILGNSRAYRHYYENDWSSILNLNTTNLSLPGAPLIHLEAMLDDYVNIYYPDVKNNKKNGWQGRLCWDTPFICSYNKLTIKKKNGYLIINKLQN